MMNLSSLFKSQIILFIIFLLTIAIYATGASIEVFTIVVLIMTLASIAFIQKGSNEIKRSATVLEKLKRGEFEERILNITESGDIALLQHSTNGMIDCIDAFIRESTAVMKCVENGEYYRRILETGMNGSLLSWSRSINNALDSSQASQEGFSEQLMSMTDNFDTNILSFLKEISESMANLSDISAGLDKIVEKGDEQAKILKKTSGNASDNVDNVAFASGSLSNSIEEMSEQINLSSSIANDAVAKVKEASDSILDLKENSDKIGEFVTMIKAIAEKTNMLALNATIEAARAGDAGRGFAVVASEVKALASQTALATEEIERQVNYTQESSQDTVETIEEISTIIVSINDILLSISASMGINSAAMDEIANSTKSAADSVSEVSAIADAVIKSSEEVKAASINLNSAAENINNKSRMLNDDATKVLTHIKTV